ncbi:hypothetical protein [Microcella humidisoli]|uniref:Uncharacterized protein n=1 Tax=Microcella humidisoli TaxID=2963406 RepID=A0ABY5FYF5_9MICO|nr:hypothetical protein [Microcella humidisoli]UTT62900.1 hypothetical protein NNL39_01960 [Microcella humidisoli]
MITTSWLRSPWDADPLSWFTTPNLPLAAAALSLVHGIIVLGPSGQAGSRPLVQVAALGLATVALLWVHIATRPRFGGMTIARALVAVVLTSAALVVSAAGYLGEAFAIQLWWAPLSASLLLLSLAPYTSALRLVLFGAVLLGVGAVTIVLLVVPDETAWPPFAIAVITLFPIVVGVVGGVVMIRTITMSLTRWSERPLDVPGTLAPTDELVASVDRATSERIAPAVSFLTAVLERGSVTAGDTARAAAIAERLRSELAGVVDRTWIERVADGRAVTVDDPDRLAERLDLAQRTAMRALLDALLGDIESPLGSARIQLRRTDHGAIAVALRILSTMAEGRRETFLAPYYVNLQSTVDNLRWRTGPVTAVEFEVAAGSRGGSRVQRTPEPGTPGGPVAR